jgi:hypothetical protein
MTFDVNPIARFKLRRSVLRFRADRYLAITVADET